MKRLLLLLLTVGIVVQLCSMDAPIQEAPIKRISRVALWEAVLDNDVQGVKNFIENHQPFTAIALNRPSPLGEMILSFAAQQGNIQIVSMLIAAGADVNKQDISGNVPLHYAVDRNRYAIINMLIEANADVNIKNQLDQTPLILAALKGSDQSVKKLIAAGARLDEKDDLGYTALDNAQMQNNFSVAQILRAAERVQKGVVVSAPVEGDGKENITKVKKKIQGQKAQKKGEKVKKKKPVVQSPAMGESIWQAAANGDLKQVDFRIAAGWTGNDKNSAGETPLMLAAEGGHEQIVATFIKRKGIKINQTDLQANTALIKAINAGHVATAQLLLDAGADPNIINKKGETSLLMAIVKGVEDLVDPLIQAGADVNQQLTMDHQYSMLMVAIDLNRAKIIPLLMRAGADINAKASTGATALMIAAARDNVELVKQLLALGASLEQKDDLGRTALDYAKDAYAQKVVTLLQQIKVQQEERQLRSESLLNMVYAGNLREVEALLKQDVNLEIANEFGETPLAIAAHKGDRRILSLLAGHGAKVDARGNTGLTPLHSAVMGGRIEIALLLLQHGAHINARDFERGRTPLHWVVRMTEGSVKKESDQLPIATSIALIRFLLERGADASLVDFEGKTALYWAKVYNLEPLVTLLEQAPVLRPKSPLTKSGSPSPKQKKKGGKVQPIASLSLSWLLA